MTKRQATTNWDSVQEDFVQEDEDTDTFKRINEDEVKNRIILKANRLLGNNETSEISPFAAFRSGNPLNFLSTPVHEDGDSKSSMLKVTDTTEYNSSTTVNEEGKDKELNVTNVRQLSPYTLACSSKASDEFNKVNKESGIVKRGPETNPNIEGDNDYPSFKRLTKLTKRPIKNKTKSATVPFAAFRDYNWFSGDVNPFHFPITEHDDSARLNPEIYPLAVSSAFNYSSTSRSSISLLKTEYCDRSAAISKDRDENENAKGDNERINYDLKATNVHDMEYQTQPYSLDESAMETTQLDLSNSSDLASISNDYKNTSDGLTLAYKDGSDSRSNEENNPLHSSVITMEEPLLNNANNENNLYLNSGGNFEKEDGTDNETNFRSNANDDSTFNNGGTKMDTTTSSMSSGLTENLTNESMSETESSQFPPAAETEEESSVEKNPFHSAFDQNTAEKFSSFDSNFFNPFPHATAFLPFPLRLYLSSIFSSEMY